MVVHWWVAVPCGAVALAVRSRDAKWMRFTPWWIRRQVAADWLPHHQQTTNEKAHQVSLEDFFDVMDEHEVDINEDEVDAICALADRKAGLAAEELSCYCLDSC